MYRKRNEAYVSNESFSDNEEEIYIFYDEDERKVKIHKDCDDEDYLKVLQHYYSILDTESEEIFNKCNIDNNLIKLIYGACLESENEENNEEKLNNGIKQNNIKKIPKSDEENNNI